MRLTLLLLSSILVLLLSACTKPSMSEQELKAYITNEKNGLVQHSANNLVEATCYYRPVELIIAQKLAGENSSLQTIDSMRQAHAALHFFVLHVSRNGKELETYFASDPSQYNAVLTYLNSSIYQDLKLVTKKGVINPVQTIYTPALGASNHTSIMVVFDTTGEEVGSEWRLSWSDTLFSSGDHSFTYQLRDINAIPTLNF